jgi:hypothetical protein
VNISKPSFDAGRIYSSFRQRNLTDKWPSSGTSILRARSPSLNDDWSLTDEKILFCQNGGITRAKPHAAQTGKHQADKEISVCFSRLIVI